jgi:pyruvate,water dikinase
MKNASFEELKKLVLEYNLSPSTQRNLSLLTQTIITLAYTVYLRKKMGFSYEAIAMIGKEGYFQTMYNLEHIENKTKEYIIKNKEKGIEKFLSDLMAEFRLVKTRVMNSLLLKDDNKKLAELVDSYLDYMRTIGTINCFWRYIGEKEHDELLSDEMINKISKNRDEIAKLYPEIENMLAEITDDIGKKNGFKGDLLRYLSYKEIQEYIKNGISKEKLAELEKRKKGYFYIFVEKENEEYIATDNEILSKLKKQFFEVGENISEVKGFAAYKGIVKGKVFNLLNSKKPSSKEYILVAHSTHPNELQIIKNSIGIVVDEGGLLCHAAVIARELKKPCLIGTKIATKVFSDGETVELNADKGTAKKVI